MIDFDQLETFWAVEKSFFVTNFNGVKRFQGRAHAVAANTFGFTGPGDTQHRQQVRHLFRMWKKIDARQWSWSQVEV